MSIDETSTSRSYIPADAPGVTTPEGAPPSNTAGVADAVRAALKEDDRVNHHLIEVRMEGGTVYLDGRQDTVDACDDAAQIAESVAGAGAVVSNLDVRPSV
ncbi:MAG: BON domain-containing protein [Chloroflexi bacterium]|nr:BON domain-containing protein [Chloroflexota bacterium]